MLEIFVSSRGGILHSSQSVMIMQNQAHVVGTSVEKLTLLNANCNFTGDDCVLEGCREMLYKE